MLPQVAQFRRSGKGFAMEHKDGKYRGEGDSYNRLRRNGRSVSQLNSSSTSSPVRRRR